MENFATRSIRWNALAYACMAHYLCKNAKLWWMEWKIYVNACNEFMVYTLERFAVGQIYFGAVFAVPHFDFRFGTILICSMLGYYAPFQTWAQKPFESLRINGNVRLMAGKAVRGNAWLENIGLKSFL